MNLDIAEAIRIIRQGGMFIVDCKEGHIVSLERVREKQFLLTLNEFLERAEQAGLINQRNTRLP